MSDSATADDKKDPPKLPDLKTKDTFTEKVTIREKTSDPTAPFINPVKDVQAVYGEVDGKKVVWVISSKAPKGSEITDQKTGDVYVVDKADKGRSNFLYTMCHITKKP